MRRGETRPSKAGRRRRAKSTRGPRRDIRCIEHRELQHCVPLYFNRVCQRVLCERADHIMFALWNALGCFLLGCRPTREDGHPAPTLRVEERLRKATATSAKQKPRYGLQVAPPAPRLVSTLFDRCLTRSSCPTCVWQGVTLGYGSEGLKANAPKTYLGVVLL